MNSNEKDLDRRLVMYLDNAMSAEEAKQFVSELDNYPEHKKKLEKEQSFRTFLRQKVSKRSVSQNLINSIKSKIRTQE